MVTVDDLTLEIKETHIDALTDQSEEVAARCIEKARTWVSARLRRCGSVLDETESVVRDAIIKRSLYELYAYVENEEVARDKAEDADTLLRSFYGDCIDGEAKPVGRPTAALVPGSASWQGYA